MNPQFPTSSNSRRRWLWTVPFLALLIAATPLRENYFELSKQLEIMTAMFRELNIYYVDEIQPGELMEAGIDAMVNSLDPYTVYYPESRIEDLRFMTTGEYGGIGASIQFMNDRHLFIDVLPDFPAAKAGLKILLGLFVYGFTTFIVVGALVFWWAASAFKAPGPLQETKLISIERGSGLNAIAAQLANEGVIENTYIICD